jgi:hypothetical protein
MDRKNARLSLNRETVRELLPADLEQAAGGMDSSEVCALATAAYSQLSAVGECITNNPKLQTRLCLTLN